MKPATRTSILEGPVQDVYEDVLLMFARDASFKEKGPGAFFFQSSTGIDPCSFTFGELSDEAAFHAKAAAVFEEAQTRAVFERGRRGGTNFVSIRCEEAAQHLFFYGWEWVDAQAFLLAVATRLRLSVPSAARLTTRERSNLSPAIRALLFA